MRVVRVLTVHLHGGQLSLDPVCLHQAQHNQSRISIRPYQDPVPRLLVQMKALQIFLLIRALQEQAQ